VRTTSSIVVLIDLVPGVLAALPVAEEDDEAILDAALDQAVAYGLERMTMDDVARRAGVGRMTVYRRYATKDDLVRRLLAREARAIVAHVAASASAEANLADRVVAAFVATLRVARAHPLIDRIVRVEPESLFQLAALEDPDLLALARAFVAAELRAARKAGAIGAVDVDHVAEVVIRLVISFVVLPRGVVDVADEAEARAFARTVLVPILTGAPSARKEAAR
jgi:AcrR family transcriptional regulator